MIDPKIVTFYTDMLNASTRLLTNDEPSCVFTSSIDGDTLTLVSRATFDGYEITTTVDCTNPADVTVIDTESRDTPEHFPHYVMFFIDMLHDANAFELGVL